MNFCYSKVITGANVSRLMVCAVSFISSIIIVPCGVNKIRPRHLYFRNGSISMILFDATYLQHLLSLPRPWPSIFPDGSVSTPHID